MNLGKLLIIELEAGMGLAENEDPSLTSITKDGLTK